MNTGIVIWSIFGCDSSSNSTASPTDEIVLIEPVPLEGERLDSLKLARRVSLDLRGKYLSNAEAQQILENPDALDSLVDAWLDEPAHKEQLVSLFAAMTLTKVDEFNVNHQDYGLQETLAYPFVLSIGEEAPRLMAEIATEDRPWTDLVTADFTMANALLIDIWELESIEQEPTTDSPWVKARFKDGRPAGGIISTNGLWWRHYTTPNNKSRSRASFLTKFLVCDDHFTRETAEIPVLRADDGNVDEMAMEDPVCKACHITLDPVSAALYGFWQHDIHDVLELQYYHPEREWMGEDELNLQMAWYGKPLASPAELGPAIANDGRFASCAVSSLAEKMWRRQLVEEDNGRLQQLLFAFQDGELRYSSLLKAIIQSPEYQLGEGALADSRHRSAAKLLYPAQMASAITDLTTFEWIENEIPMLDNDELGLRILLGGIDGRMVNTWAVEPSSSRQLAYKRFSQLAADQAVELVWERPDALDIFDQQDITAIDASSSQFETIVHSLSIRILAEEPTPEQLELYKQIFTQIAQAYDEKQAWKSLLSIIFRDSEAWIY